MYILKHCIASFLFMACVTSLSAQDSAAKTLSLDDMSAFKPQSGNWQIVGDVTMDPAVDIHQQETTAEVPVKKKKKNQPVAQPPRAVTFQAGKGILLNMNDAVKKDNLITNFEHGDIELELEVMIPKGSNSGIFLQGRYEVQLLDSWGVKNPMFSDIGGIYRNWETAPGKIYMGKAPLTNAAKAPGLWQKMKISFRAPRFDASGNKIANAKFASVELNGVKIHDNIEVPLLTGAPIENNEKPLGPLMIQGDHGPVAFRNIKYTLMKNVSVSLGDIQYKTYAGKFKVVEDFAALSPVATGTLPEISCEAANADNEYALIFKGNLTVPEDANYLFTVAYSGGMRFVVNGQKLIDFQRADGSNTDAGSIALKAGSYPVEIYNFKDVSWIPPRLAVFVKTDHSYPQALHAFNSYPPDDNPVSSIFVNPRHETKLLRAFLDFNGDRKKRLTHTIGVSDPNGIHYVYDMESGNIACVWRGDFVDATPMWHDRGDGSFRPRGAVQYFFINEPLAFLSEPNEAFPSTGSEEHYRAKGYEIDEATGRPTFNYIYQGLEVKDKIYPDDNNRIITHEISLKERGTKQGLYYKIAEGTSIVSLPDGSYAVNDKQYYVKVGASAKPAIREVNGMKELVVPFDTTSLTYSIIW